MRRLLHSIVFILAFTSLVSHAAFATLYTIDAAQSELVVQLFKTGVGAALAHDHVVRAAQYTGQISVDPAAPTTAVVTIEVDATSLTVDEPDTRRKYGPSSLLSEGERREIQLTLESESQLSVRRYPTIRFRSARVEPQGEGHYTVTGELEIRGVTQPVTLSVQAELKNNAIRGKGSCRFLQSSFGYAPYSAFWGAVQNKDEVVLHFDIVALQQ